MWIWVGNAFQKANFYPFVLSMSKGERIKVYDTTNHRKGLGKAIFPNILMVIIFVIYSIGYMTFMQYKELGSR